MPEKSPRKAPVSSLRAKRVQLAEAMNRHLNTTVYSGKHKDILSLPEAVLNSLLEYYDDDQHGLIVG